MVSVEGKWALVTGASRGIGRLIALFMARRGCNLVLHSRDLEHTQKLKGEIEAAGGSCYAVQADLAENDQVVAMLDDIQSRGTEIDILFNNAGMQVGYRGDYWHTPIEDFEMSFRVNFIAVTTICYRLIPQMIGRGFGRVINTSSDIDKEPEQAGYSASKAALDKFTRDIGSKLDGSGVQINLCNPGWCRTDLGGPHAPNAPETAIPGVVIGAFIEDGVNGRCFHAQKYKGLSLEGAVSKAEGS